MVGVKSRSPSFHLFSSLVTLVAAAATAFSIARAHGATPAAVTIGYVASDGASDLKSRGQELASMIEKRTGIKVNTYAGGSYADLVQQMIDKNVDFAFLSALAYVEAEDRTGLKVLLKKVWQQGFYYSVLLVKSSSKIRKLADLKGKRIAFVDEKSASGYLYPRVFLRGAGIDPTKDFKTVVFTGSHEKSVDLLRKGDVDVIAVFANDKRGEDSAWTHQKNPSSAVRVVWSSAAIPNDPFCVRDSFYSEFPTSTHDLMFGLAEIDKDPSIGPEFKRLLGITSLVPATSQQYDPVREMFRLIKRSEDPR